MTHATVGPAPDRARVSELKGREEERFWRERPRSVKLRRRGLESMPNGVPMGWFVSLYQQDPIYVADGVGAHIVDVDGHRYLDTNVTDVSTFCGYAPPAVTEAIAAREVRGCSSRCPSRNPSGWRRRWGGGSGFRAGSSPFLPPRPTSRRSGWPASPPGVP